jgi:peptidoglycan/LPS O-acetylase OafA/YrhL
MLQDGWITTLSSYNGPSWSLSIEIMMYLLFFAVFYNTRETKKYILYCFLLIYLGIFITLSGDNKPFFNSFVARGLIGFFIGCITGEVYEYCGKNKKLGNIFTVFCGIAIIFLTIILVLFEHRVVKIENWSGVYVFAFFPALVFVVLRIKVLSAVFSIRPLLYLGNLSYSIYLIHYPLQLIVKTIDEYCKLRINYSDNVFFAGFSLMVIIISHFLYYCCEKPVQNYIRKKYIRAV